MGKKIGVQTSTTPGWMWRIAQIAVIGDLLNDLFVRADSHRARKCFTARICARAKRCQASLLLVVVERQHDGGNNYTRPDRNEPHGLRRRAAAVRQWIEPIVLGIDRAGNGRGRERRARESCRNWVAVNKWNSAGENLLPF
jgi:hypothetical protein